MRLKEISLKCYGGKCDRMDDLDKVETEVNKEADCCNKPEVTLVDLSFGWDSKNGVWRSDAYCQNCYETMSMVIGMLDVEISSG